MKARKFEEWEEQEKLDWMMIRPIGLQVTEWKDVADKVINIATREKKYRIIKDPVKLVGSIEENVKALDTIAIKDILLWFAYSGHSVGFGYHYPDVKDYRLKTSEMASGHTIPDFCVEEYTDD